MNTKKVAIVGISLFAAIGILAALFLVAKMVVHNRPVVLAKKEPTAKTDLPKPVPLTETSEVSETSSLQAQGVLETENVAATNKPTPLNLSDMPYPEALMKRLDIKEDDIIKNRDRFRDNVVHVEWMDHVRDVFKEIDPEKEEAIALVHTTLLYVKERLNDAYLGGNLDHDAFTNGIAQLMKWFQQANLSVLGESDYERLFGLTKEEGEEYIEQMAGDIPEYGFILNQKIPTDEVKKLIQGYKLELIDSHFKKMVFERDAIGKKINAGEMTLEEAGETLRKSQAAFIGACKEILTEREIEIIFGSMENLEMGMSTEMPDWKRSEEVLGFPLENHETTIETVREKLDEKTIGEMTFFHRQRKQEIIDIGEVLDAGDIKLEDAKAMAGDIHAAYVGKCREILTPEQFRLIFGNTDG